MKVKTLLTFATLLAGFLSASTPARGDEANSKGNAKIDDPSKPAQNGPTKTKGDPVGCMDGSVYETAVDLRIPCPDIDLVLKRAYVSRLAEASALGCGWVDAYGWRLGKSDSQVTLYAYADMELPAHGAWRRFDDPAAGAQTTDHAGYRLARDGNGRYSVVTPAGTRYDFNASNRLVRVSSWNGTSVTLERDAPTGPIRRAVHANGAYLAFDHSEEGQVVRVTPSDPTVWVEYGYDRKTRPYPTLISAIRHDGARASTNLYRYVKMPAPRGTKDPATWLPGPDYDPAMRPGNGWKPSPMLWLPSPNLPASPPGATWWPLLAAKTDANGVTTRYEYVRTGDGPDARCVRSTMDDGLLETFFTYGTNETVVLSPFAGGVSEMRLRYDDADRETSRRIGVETRAAEYDAAGNPARVTLRNAATGFAAETRTAFDGRHRPISTATRLRVPGDGNSDLPPPATTVWDDRRGIPRRTVSPAGRVGEWVEDGHDVTVFGAGTNDARLVTRILCSTNDRPEAVITPAGGRIDFAYGDDGRIAAISAEGLPSVALTYDALGHSASETLPGPNGSTRTTRYERNWRGRPTRIDHPDGTAETFAYDGNGTKVVRRTDALGRTDTYKWVLGLPVHALRIADGGTNRLFGVEHDRQLNVVAITDPLGRRAESYVLDGNMRVVAVTNEEGRVMTRRYALGDLVASETRFDGSEVHYAYNTAGRLARMAYPGGELALGYDADGLPTVVSDGASAVSNGWDAATGWLVKSRGADGTEVGYLYRNDGAVTSVVSVAGGKALGLDPYGRWTRVESAAGTAVFGYSDWNGLAAAVTNGATVAEYAYDLMDRVTNVAWRTVGGESLGGIAYEHDALGRITARSLVLGDESFDRAYAYDGCDRLASDGGVSYRYDAAGNRLAKVGDAGGDISYALGIGDRLAAWTDGAYGYDAAGCVTRIRRGSDVLDLTWDGLYRLVSVSTNGVESESYRYDALGRRTATTNAEGTERHVWDGDHCLADIDEEGNVLRAYLWGPGVDNLLAVRVGGRNYAALTDIQGTVWGYADERGEIVARWTYDAWGNVLSEEIAESAEALRFVRYRFQGREFSRATGLTNFRARWYDPTTGRWLSKDPIRLNGGLNQYEFCFNDSINYVDREGEYPFAPAYGFCLPTLTLPEIPQSVAAAGVFTLSFGIGQWISQEYIDQEYLECLGSQIGTWWFNNITIRFSYGGHGKGERGRTARPDGTPNPQKKFRPTKDGGWEYKDSNGKKIKKPKGFHP